MKHIINLSIFLMLAIIVWWSITNYHNTSSRLQTTKNKDYAEIFMNEFKITSMNKNGNPNYILQGAHLQRANDSDDAKIKQPIFYFYQEKTQWVINAQNAIINDKNKTIQLKNNVVMKQKDTSPAVTVRTQSILIHTKTQIASTNAAVDITHGKSHFTSKGMLFNNTTNELILSSQVKGHYSPYE